MYMKLSRENVHLPRYQIQQQKPLFLKTVLNFWPWEYCRGWVYMVLFGKPRWSFTKSLEQPVVLKSGDDMNIHILLIRLQFF